jgi:hypothetical protein
MACTDADGGSSAPRQCLQAPGGRASGVLHAGQIQAEDEDLFPTVFNLFIG